MRLLHIVRHAPVTVDPHRALADWKLAPGAEASVRDLILGIDPARLRRVVSSREGKARKTDRIIAAGLNLPVQVVDGLEEHHRLKEDHVADGVAFRQSVAEFFGRPDHLVFGQETASEALGRFQGAIQRLLEETENDQLVVSHGMVMSLFLASAGNGTPLALWSDLKFPDHVAVLWPSRSIA